MAASPYDAWLFRGLRFRLLMIGPHRMAFIVFEDEHLLVVNKPAGWNTHSPAPFAGEGIYEWLRNREPRWSDLSIIHRLDKETSGLMVFGKTSAANRSLTQQFESRSVEKKYILQSDRKPGFRELRAHSALVRSGAKYLSRPPHTGAVLAETLFTPRGNFIEAVPLTGRTHQIRVHAAEHGFPILGDELYGGTRSSRLHLHSAELHFQHPVTKARLDFCAPPNFEVDPALALREAIIEPQATDAFRLLHGAADDCRGLYVDKLGEDVLAQSENPITPAQLARVASLNPRTVYHQLNNRQGRSQPEWISGGPAATELTIRENGLRYLLRLDEGGSIGLFLDQRENRRRLKTRCVAPKFELPPAPEVLNVFAYTCGFSVCAAAGGGRVTSLDLSKKYLEWGRENFALNGIDPAQHDFIYGDALIWFRRLGKKGRLFDIIVLDPPTFSRSKESGVFQAERDFGALTAAALPLLKPGGTLLASTNAAMFPPEHFASAITEAIRQERRTVEKSHYVPQPPDFPIDRNEPAYLKTAWFRIR